MYIRENCVFCDNLKLVLINLKNKNLINTKINWLLASQDEAAPYILKNKNQKLSGFPEQKTLYSFLEINE